MPSVKTKSSNESFLALRQHEILMKIGQGTFSKVFLTRYKGMGMATKIIDKNRVSSKFAEKFLPRELDMLIKLKHPFIVKASGLIL